MDIDEQKRVLRSEARATRMGIPDEARARAAEAIARRLLALPALRNARVVGAYHAVGSELSLACALGQIARLDPAPAIAYPLVRSESAMAFAQLDSDELRLLDDPKAIVAAIDPQKLVAPTELDVVLVPGLAFCEDGRRLGQGGGYYDRYLPKLREDCIVIGMAFDEQLAGDIPADAHDVRMDYVLTPTLLVTP